MLKVKVINRSGFPLPEYATGQSAGLDLKAALETPLLLEPGHRFLIPTGLYLELPPGYEAQIRPRSGLALKQGLTLLNSPGTIDPDYRGEIGVILINLGMETARIMPGDRIAQMVIASFQQIQWQAVETLETTQRGSGGFGHTGN